MNQFFNIDIINISIGCVILSLSAILLMTPIPSTRRWKNFRSARAALAVAYIVLSALMITNGLVGSGGSGKSGMITLVIAFYQALLYTRTCVLFLKPVSDAGVSYKAMMVAVTLFSAVLAVCYAVDTEVFKWMFYAGLVLYAKLMVYCTVKFTTVYRTTLQRLEDVYDEDMHYRVRWVKRCFYSALLIGIMAWFMSVFYHTEPSEIDDSLCERLQEWVKQKRFHNSEMTLIDIEKELDTTRSALNEYTMNRYGVNFRTWRNLLRIEEAKMLLSDSDIPVAEIFHTVGYTDRSNFHRQFTEIVGLTPTQYRKNHAS